MLAFVLTARVAIAGTTQLVYNALSGTRAGDISADGRYVLFWAVGREVDPEGTATTSREVFVVDRETGRADRVSVGTSGEESYNPDMGAMSPDGRFATFRCYGFSPEDANGNLQIFVRDRQSGTTECASRSSSGELANQHCWGGAISADGRFIAFSSDATNLVPDDTNGVADVFVRDRGLGTTERVSVDGAGMEGSGQPRTPRGPSISADGRVVAFASTMRLVPEDTNNYEDIYVRDRVGGTTRRVSVTSTGEQASYYSETPAVSADGRWVAFTSYSSDMFPGPAFVGGQVCIYDLETSSLERVSVDSAENVPDGESWSPAISADGRFVAFTSYATDLVVGDSNECEDIFVRDRAAGSTLRVSVSSSGGQADWFSDFPHISATGRFITFFSAASNLVAEDTNDQYDGFIRDQQYYTDIAAGFWAYDAIVALTEAGVAGGYPDGKYHPGWPVKRDQMAAYLARAMAGGDEEVPDTGSPPTFADVPPSNWAYRYVEYLASCGLFLEAESPRRLYSPDGLVDRASLALHLALALAEDGASIPPGPAIPSFPDVPRGHWAYRYVEYAAARGVIQGYEDGCYHPQAVVTRDQMAVFVQRLLALL
jgi:Tol biopolymer transport system component